jgi:hypothetical protein
MEMKLKNLSMIDDQFVTAKIVADSGTIVLEAEVLPVGPIHVEQAVWKETGTDALSHVSQHLGAVRSMIEMAMVESV